MINININKKCEYAKYSPFKLVQKVGEGGGMQSRLRGSKKKHLQTLQYRIMRLAL